MHNIIVKQIVYFLTNYQEKKRLIYIWYISSRILNIIILLLCSMLQG